MRIQTTYHKSIIDPEVATELYSDLKSKILWDDAIYSTTRGKTVSRLGNTLSIPPETATEFRVLSVVSEVLERTELKNPVLGVYLNYYRDGRDWAPAHSHTGDVFQLVISLEGTRQLRVSNKVYDMNSGDAIVFGSAVHTVLRDESVKTGRISLAVFLKK